MLTFVLAALLTSADVTEFFPLTPGMSWTYTDDSSGSTQTFVDTVGNEQEIGGTKVKPIVSKVGGRVDGSTFYQVTENDVFVVAFEQNKPLDTPYPIIKLGEGKTTWEFRGNTQWLGDPSPLTVTGSCRHTGSKELFGKKRETIEVVLDAVIGPNTNAGLRSHQVYTYASGIGLIELKDTSKVGKNKTERKRVLVSFKTEEKF